MCFVGSKKYTYLSMCSCCNVVSKYSSMVKSHLQRKHKKKLSKSSDVLVIPIRIENRFRKKIKCTLDKVISPNKLVRKKHKVVVKGRKKEKSDFVEKEIEFEEVNLPVYKCKSCEKCFHTLPDLEDHVERVHAVTVANSKPTRKRKLPKWLESDMVDTTSKKTKGASVTKKEEAVEEMSKRAKVGKENECEYCGYIAKTDSAMMRHIKRNHRDSEERLNKSPSKNRRNRKQFNEDGEEQEKGKDKETKSAGVDYSQVESMPKEDRRKGHVDNEDLDVSKETNADMDKLDIDIDDNDPTNFGDSDDDYQPENSDTDSEKEDPAFNICMYCNNTFTSQKSLVSHVRKKHKSAVNDDVGVDANVTKKERKTRFGKNLKTTARGTEDSEKFVARYKCPFCELHLYNMEYIKSHIHQSHPEVTNFRVNTKEIIEKSLCEEIWESFKCPNICCNVTYKKKQALIDHIALCTKGKSKKEDIICTLPSSWMKKLQKTVCLICPYCDLVIQGKVEFEKHLVEHYPDKIFEIRLSNTLPSMQSKTDKCRELECSMCTYCEILTTQKAQLTNKHFKRFHSNEVGSDVITCILTNKSVKESAELIVKDRKSPNLSEQHKVEKLVTAIQNRNDKTASDLSASEIDEIVNSEETDCEIVEQTCDSKHCENKLEGTHGICEANEEEVNKFAETVYIHSTIPVGTYICPLCNDFKTRIKKEIKLHMDEHNRKSEDDIDAIFIIPETWIKMEEGEQLCFKCQFCDFQEANLTLAFRHTLETHKDVTVNQSDLDADKPGPLFEIMNAQIQGVKERFERQKYRCTMCMPGHIFKSKKGLQLHMKTKHSKSETPAVYETMYQMLDLISDTCDTRQVYLCCVCNEQLSTKLNLIHHFKEYHSESYDKLVDTLNCLSETSSIQPSCEVCCKQFTDMRNLKHHLILHMNKFKPTCHLCDVCFTNNAELDCHNMEIHSKSGEMCYKCGAMFTTSVELNRHVRSHDAGEAHSMKTLCQHCGVSLIKKNMKKHLVDKHIELISCECDICVTREVTEGKKSVTCDQCEAIFCTWYVLRSHKYKEHNQVKVRSFKCRSCSVTFSNRRDHSVHAHKCGKLATTDLDQGASRSNDENILEVTVSDEANIDFDLGLAHVKREYISIDKESEKSFSCKLCLKAFSKLKYICNHLKRMHTRDETKRYRCKVCKMGFLSKKEFMIHCRSHTGFRQFQCEICQKRYKTAAHLKEHYEIHSSQTYACCYCGLEFRQRGSVMAHVVHHDKLKPFKCLYCGKGYTTQGDLQRHMNSYSKGSKISRGKSLTFCSYCSKDYANHNALVKHFQMHYPVNPFKCSVCFETFSTFRQMYNHKAKKLHFTTAEIEEGRKDLQEPGNKFRKYQVSKSKTEIEMARKGTKYLEDTTLANNMLGTLDDRHNIIEIEIGTSVEEIDERTRADIEEFESDVIKSMLDADPEVLDSVDFHSVESKFRKEKHSENHGVKSVLHDGYHFEIPSEHNNFVSEVTMQDMYEEARHDQYNISHHPPQNETDDDNTDQLAAMVVESIQQQESAARKTQTFQASDGSIIHVCVIKPDK